MSFHGAKLWRRVDGGQAGDYTEPYGSVFSAPRRLLWRPRRSHPPRHPRTPRQRRCVHHGVGGAVRYDAYRYEETRGHSGGCEAGDYGESRTRAYVQAGAAPDGRRDSLDRHVPANAGITYGPARGFPRANERNVMSAAAAASETVNRATLTTPSDREIRTERIFNAPRDKVWRAFTEPELIAQWWGRGNKLAIERYEFERGGHWRYVEHAEGETHGFEGRFREITPKDRIVMTFEWDGMPGHVIIESATFE